MNRFDEPRLRPAARWIVEHLPTPYTTDDLNRLLDEADKMFDLALSGGATAILLAEVRFVMGDKWQPATVWYEYDDWGFGDDDEILEDE